MSRSFTIYCDESCHLPRDHQPVMSLGALRVPTEMVPEIALRIREIKMAHGLHPSAELKWGKVSPKWLPVYERVVDYFFSDRELGFRVLVAEKEGLDHAAFNQTHDDWYYKMYYLLLTNFIESSHEYQVYLDIKDTRGGPKVAHLHQVLCNGMYDFREDSLKRIQTVRSHEVQAIQLADILVGAAGYANRPAVQTSEAKLSLVRRIEEHAGRSLKRSTPPREAKFNVFHWQGSRTPQ